MKKRIWLLILLVAIIALSIPTNGQTIDDQLRLKDQAIERQFSAFPHDARYDAIMNGIAEKLNAAIVKTFKGDKKLEYYVCPSHIGFNALSFNKFTVYDSLLLDSLRYLAEGAAKNNGIDNPYIDQLARRVAEVSRLRQSGAAFGDFSNRLNPFGLPEPGKLSQPERLEAEKLSLQCLHHGWPMKAAIV